MGATISNEGRRFRNEPDVHPVHAEIDLGSTLPNGLYPSLDKDYDARLVRKMIIAKRLAPFYNGLAEPPSSKCAQALWNEAVECPICFLYYPANINHSRCCAQPICTECFIQIQKQPSTCPFCVCDTFGVVYTSPSWAARSADTHKGVLRRTTSAGILLRKGDFLRRKKSANETPDVVYADHLKPPPSTTKQPYLPHSVTYQRRRSALPLFSTFYSRNTAMQRPPPRSMSLVEGAEEYASINIEEWMLMEAVRLSLQDHHRRIDAPRNDLIESSLSLASTSSGSQPTTETTSGLSSALFPHRQRSNPLY